MSNVKAVFTNQGIIVGEVVSEHEGNIEMKNPVMAIPQQHNMAMIPFLALMEEDTILMKKGDYNYNKVFTPTIDLRNHYNQMFGVGIVEVSKPGIALA